MSQNRIGVTSAGTLFANHRDGIHLSEGSSGNFMEANVIFGNDGNGVMLDHAGPNNEIGGNFIGFVPLPEGGDFAIGNGRIWGCRIIAPSGDGESASIRVFTLFGGPSVRKTTPFRQTFAGGIYVG